MKPIRRHPNTHPSTIKLRIITFCLTGISLAWAASALRAAEAGENHSEAARLQRLEAAVEQLQKENAALKEQVGHLNQNRLAPVFAVPDGKSVVSTPPEKKPIFVVPAGPEYKLVLGGFIQGHAQFGDVSAFEGRFPGLNQVNDRFRLRRARINVSGEFAEDFDFKLEGDFGQGDGLSSGRTAFSGTDIFINWHHFPEANIKVGQWKAPFGQEQLTPDTTTFIIERGLPTGAITPERQIGVQMWGKPLTNLWSEQKDLVTYYAGIFNGSGRNTSVNDNNEFMYVGRLELLPFSGKLFGQDARLKLGGDYLSSRDEAGVNISQTLNLKLNSDGSLTPFVLPSAGEREAWSIDASLHLGQFDLIAEYLEERVRPRTSGGAVPGFSKFKTNGYYVQGSYFVVPQKLQAAVKWESFNPGQAADDDIKSLTAGLNYYIHGDSLKLMADYIHTWSDFRSAHRDLGSDEFDEVILRLQLMF